MFLHEHPFCLQRSHTNIPFLGNYSNFKKDKKNKNLLIYGTRPSKSSNTKNLFLTPFFFIQALIQIAWFFLQKKKWTRPLFQNMWQQLLKQRQDRQRTGPKRHPHSLAIRGLKPGRYYFDSRGSRTIQSDTKLADGDFELEAIDSLSGERVLALVNFLKDPSLKPGLKKTRKPCWKTVHKLTDCWM